MKSDNMDEKINNLPMLPTIVVKLMTLSPQDNAYFDKVLEYAEQDPLLALKIIKISNSVKYSSVKPVLNLKEAIIRLGVNEIHGLVASIAVTKVFVPNSPAEKRLWQHSIQVAFVARMLAYKQPELELDAEKAYLCGLFHDLGLFLRFEQDQEEFNHIDDFVWSTPKQHLIAEKQLFAQSHNELSCKICRAWGTPSPIPEIVLLHHTYQLPAKVTVHPKLTNMIRILQLADICSEMFRVGDGNSAELVVEAINEAPYLKLWCDNNAELYAIIDAHLSTCLDEAELVYKQLGI
ncbi:HDOD domain-containing protein [Psychrosphaera sp. F3M07]|uniref:HDOD domain-containing protein n=1 Tax=Psychrosphaera sp. F3M07 TaxID=2841560 RepID=UPI001C08A44E|nr:HDOD domain-containing protein [Psychrosphaera sp. F3M07]MBU2917957.1 HDOD domain-containing protein [Psychrosphaera sp. F3M07]